MTTRQQALAQFRAHLNAPGSWGKFTVLVVGGYCAFTAIVVGFSA